MHTGNNKCKNCTLDEGVNAATGSSCDIPQRRLINGTGDFLNYTIHENGYASQGGSVWGCSTLSEASVDFVTSDRNTLHVNLELPEGQNAVLGSYSDTVTVNITF